MAGLVRLDLDEVLRHVAAVAAAHPEVLAAHVFGSAIGEMRPDSDIDVGVTLWPEAERTMSPWGCEGPLEADLGWWHAHPYHVTVLSEAGAIFGVKALGQSRAAYVADQDAFASFVERLARRNWMTAWRYWNAVAEVNGWDPRQTPSASPTGPGT